jgi:hypothetical protein
MIDMVTGYTSIPRFQGFGQSGTPVATQPLALAPPPNPTNALIENAVVFGGVPLLGYIFVTKKGPSAWLAALLGVGIGYLYWQSGAPALPSLPAAPSIPTPAQITNLY